MPVSAAPPPPVRLEAIPRPDKAELASRLADRLGVSHPYTSTGSSVDSKFLDTLHEALGFGPNPGRDSYRKCEAVLSRLGLVYDAVWDTSEWSPTGGGTISARPFSRVLAHVTATPRVFAIPSVLRRLVGTNFELYYDDLIDRQTLHEAGPGTRLWLHRPDPRGHRSIVATAVIADIAPGWRGGPWTIRLSDYAEFDRPAHVQLLRDGRPVTDRRAVEVDPALWVHVRTIGGLGAAPGPAAAEPAATVAATFTRAAASTPVPKVRVPPALTGPVTLPAPTPPTYTNSAPQARGFPARDAAQRELDRQAEQRAVTITLDALQAQGWTVIADRQRDGVGYDFDLHHSGRDLHLEVKGIQGPAVEFNVTPKERWRAESDQDFLLAAVTSVLSPRSPVVHLLTGADLARGTWTATGFRVKMP